MPDSHAFGQFLASLHTSRDDRRQADELNLAVLGALAGDERARAEGLLLERLRTVREDLRVYSALELVGSGASVEPLRSAIRRESGLARVRAAAALAQIDSGYEPSPVFVAAVRGSDPSARTEAARHLGRSPRETALPVLLEALGDSSFGMRITAFDALLEQLDLKRYQSLDLGRVKSLGTRLLSGLRSVWGPAADEMRVVAEALEAGRTPEELGFGAAVTTTPEELDAFVAPFRSRRTDERWLERVNLDALGRLDDVGGRYVETLLLSELEHGDVSIPAALTALGGEVALAAMREALSTARGAMRVELASALERIGDATDVARAREVLREARSPEQSGPSPFDPRPPDR